LCGFDASMQDPDLSGEPKGQLEHAAEMKRAQFHQVGELANPDPRGEMRVDVRHDTAHLPGLEYTSPAFVRRGLWWRRRR